MPRSLKVQQECITKVKLALTRNGFPSQRSLAEDVGFALATVSNFLTGKPVDYTTFEELCRKLGLNWREISTLDLDIAAQNLVKLQPKLSDEIVAIDALPLGTLLPCYPNGAVPLDSPFYSERVPAQAQIERELQKPGALVRIKAPKEMGKTSLGTRKLIIYQHRRVSTSLNPRVIGMLFSRNSLIKPAQEKVKKHYDKMAEIISRHNSSPQKVLISKLNPIIRGWANYYSSGVSKKTTPN